MLPNRPMFFWQADGMRREQDSGMVGHKMRFSFYFIFQKLFQRLIALPSVEGKKFTTFKNVKI
jgi:hypothetical protein